MYVSAYSGVHVTEGRSVRMHAMHSGSVNSVCLCVRCLTLAWAGESDLCIPNNSANMHPVLHTSTAIE